MISKILKIKLITFTRPLTPEVLAKLVLLPCSWPLTWLWAKLELNYFFFLIIKLLILTKKSYNLFVRAAAITQQPEPAVSLFLRPLLEWTSSKVQLSTELHYLNYWGLYWPQSIWHWGQCHLMVHSQIQPKPENVTQQPGLQRMQRKHPPVVRIIVREHSIC